MCVTEGSANCAFTDDGLVDFGIPVVVNAAQRLLVLSAASLLLLAALSPATVAASKGPAVIATINYQ